MLCLLRFARETPILHPPPGLLCSRDSGFATILGDSIQALPLLNPGSGPGLRIGLFDIAINCGIV